MNEKFINDLVISFVDIFLTVSKIKLDYDSYHKFKNELFHKFQQFPSRDVEHPLKEIGKSFYYSTIVGQVEIVCLPRTQKPKIIIETK